MILATAFSTLFLFQDLTSSPVTFVGLKSLLKSPELLEDEFLVSVHDPFFAHPPHRCFSSRCCPASQPEPINFLQALRKRTDTPMSFQVSQLFYSILFYSILFRSGEPRGFGLHVIKFIFIFE
jgi:hypothetical protein